MIAGMHAEVLLAIGYAAFLVVIEAALEAMAGVSHRRSGRLETAGFRYHHSRDIWECPEGTTLHRATTDLHRRIVVYRAPAAVCNACLMKPECTHSDHGRAIEQDTDAWLRSEVRRFHRGMSLTLLALAALILGVELLRTHAPPEAAIVGGALLLVVWSGVGRVTAMGRDLQRKS
jgi:hypothetical protein